MRALFLVVFIPVHTLFCSILVIVSLLLRAPHGFASWLTRNLWCAPMIFLSGIQICRKGEENVPKDRGFLYLFTHSSHLDIPVLFYGSPKGFRFGAKDSLFKIPFFGQAIALFGTLRITRGDRQKVIEIYRQAEKRLSLGEAFALSPEGGRRRGDEIREFKSGPFIFAVNAKAFIVPVVLCGVDRCLPKGSILVNRDRWTRKVGLHFLPAIDVSGLKEDGIKKLKQRVHQQVLDEFESMKEMYL